MEEREGREKREREGGEGALESTIYAPQKRAKSSKTARGSRGGRCMREKVGYMRPKENKTSKSRVCAQSQHEGNRVPPQSRVYALEIKREQKSSQTTMREKDGYMRPRKGRGSREEYVCARKHDICAPKESEKLARGGCMREMGEKKMDKCAKSRKR
jgi:hypothetical protein